MNIRTVFAKFLLVAIISSFYFSTDTIPLVFAATPPYSCGIDSNHNPITSSSFQGIVTEQNAAGSGYDQTEWYLEEGGQLGGITGPQTHLVATNNSLQFTFTGLKADTFYNFYAVRKSSHGPALPHPCLDGGNINGSLRTAPVSGNGTGGTVAPSPIANGKCCVYARQSPYLTPYKPNVSSLMKQGAILAGIIVAAYLLF